MDFMRLGSLLINIGDWALRVTLRMVWPFGAYTTFLTLAPETASRSCKANAYYKLNAIHPNLKVLTGALVTKIDFAPLKTRLLAPGVPFTAGNKTFTVMAKREVLICAGLCNPFNCLI